MRASLLVVTALLLLPPAARAEAPDPAPAAAPKPARANRVAVLDLTADRDVDPGVTRALSELAMAKVQTMGIGDCIGSSEIKTLLNFEVEKRLLNCDDASCMAEIGGALGVSRLMTGTVTRVGSKYLVSLKLFDVDRARVLARTTSQVEADEDKLLAAFPSMVTQLFGSVAAEAGPATVPSGGSGTLIVRSNPNHSTVTLAGKEVGLTPLKLPGVAAGAYELQLSHTDYSTHRASITVVPDQDTIVEVELELERELVMRNYQFALERHDKDVFWQRAGGVGHAVGGCLTSLAGGVATYFILPKNPMAGIAAIGVAVLGIAWAGWGVYQIAVVPQPPPPPFADPAADQAAAEEAAAAADTAPQSDPPAADPAPQDG